MEPAVGFLSLKTTSMSSKVNCILVEDESLQMQILEQEVNQFSELKIVGKAATLQAAYQLILEKQPNLAIMDVQFQGGTIYDLFQRLKNAQIQVPTTILVSGHDNEAVRALNLYKDEVVFFILKKELDQYLRTAVDRAIAALKINPFITRDNQYGHILIRSQGYMTRVPTADICYAKSHDGRSCLITRNNDIYEVNLSLKKLIPHFPSLNLIRINKQEAVVKDKCYRVNISDKEIEINYGDRLLSFFIGPEYYKDVLTALKS